MSSTLPKTAEESRELELFKLIEGTLIVPLWVRYKDAVSKNPLLADSEAIEISKKLKNKFLKIESCPKIVRTFTFKSILSRELIINDFLEDLAKSGKEYTIINLGAGLDCRYVKFASSFKKWYDVDYSATIEFKNEYCKKFENYELVAGDIFDKDLLNKFEKENVIVLCIGTLMYYERSQVVPYVNSLIQNFKNSQFILEFIGKYGVDYTHPMLSEMNINLPYLSSLTLKDGIELIDAKLVKSQCSFDNDLVNWHYLNKLVKFVGVKTENILSSIYQFSNEN